MPNRALQVFKHTCSMVRPQLFASLFYDISNLGSLLRQNVKFHKDISTKSYQNHKNSIMPEGYNRNMRSRAVAKALLIKNNGSAPKIFFKSCLGNEQYTLPLFLSSTG